MKIYRLSFWYFLIFLSLGCKKAEQPDINNFFNPDEVSVAITSLDRKDSLCLGIDNFLTLGGTSTGVFDQPIIANVYVLIKPIDPPGEGYYPQAQFTAPNQNNNLWSTEAHLGGDGQFEVKSGHLYNLVAILTCDKKRMDKIINDEPPSRRALTDFPIHASSIELDSLVVK